MADKTTADRDVQAPNLATITVTDELDCLRFVLKIADDVFAHDWYKPFMTQAPHQAADSASVAPEAKHVVQAAIIAAEFAMLLRLARGTSTFSTIQNADKLLRKHATTHGESGGANPLPPLSILRLLVSDLHEHKCGHAALKAMGSVRMWASHTVYEPCATVARIIDGDRVRLYQKPADKKAHLSAASFVADEHQWELIFTANMPAALKG